MQLQNKTVLITGGASGIGKIMGRLVLEQGGKLVIWDIDQNKIDEVLNEFKNMGTIAAYRVDISSLSEIQTAAQKVKQDHKKIDVLINNAGIVVGKNFTEHSPTDISKTMEVNTLAPMYITREFLPEMLSANSGHICNIASAAGTVSNPKMSVYAGSKWAVVGWSDSLRLEMTKQKKAIGVTTILPYYINTGMFDGVRSKLPILDPEKVAAKIIQAILKNEKKITIPRYMCRVTRLGQAIMPIRFFDWFAGDFLGIYKTMEHFSGHQNKS